MAQLVSYKAVQATSCKARTRDPLLTGGRLEKCTTPIVNFVGLVLILTKGSCKLRVDAGDED